MNRDASATLVVAVDPSPAGSTAFREALRLAAAIGARVVAVSVTPKYEGNLNRWAIENAEEELSRPFRQCLEEARRMSVGTHVALKTEHQVGAPVECIVDTAVREGATLVVIGYPVRSYMERIILGQTAARIVGLCPCDVLMVPEGAKVDVRRILVGVDGSKYSLEAGKRALELAGLFGGEVHGLTVLDVPVDRSLLYGVMDEVRHKHFFALETLSQEGGLRGVKVVTAMREGNPYETIVGYGEENDIDLIVLGSFGRTAVVRFLLGSVVERVAAISLRPTLVVKGAAAGGNTGS